MVVSWPKEDQRALRGGWAPGGYMRVCIHCEQKFFGDKRAVSCADCAYGQPARESGGEGPLAGWGGGS